MLKGNKRRRIEMLTDTRSAISLEWSSLAYVMDSEGVIVSKSVLNLMKTEK